MPSIALAVFAEQCLDEFRIGSHLVFVAIISVDKDYQVGGLQFHLRSLVVAGRGSYTADLVTIDGQSLDVDCASSDAFVGFAGFSYAEAEGIALKLVGVKATDAVAIDNAGEVDQIYQGVDLVQCLALQHTAYQSFRGRTVA